MSETRILHLEDNPDDAFLVEQLLLDHHIDAEHVVVHRPDQFRAALSQGSIDLILSDGSLPGLSSLAALREARAKIADVPFVVLSGSTDPAVIRPLLEAGATHYILKDQLWQLAAVVRLVLSAASQRREAERLARNQRGMTRLVTAVQELSHARDVETIREIVRHAARELTGADGATFVLRDGGLCHYVDEDAIGPLWKGQKFPLSACISGWAMLNREAAVIEDIYADPRIPVDAYRPTFVKSLVMVPIRREAPIGAIGNYWASRHRATPEEVALLQALANTTSVAMENVQVYSELEQRVQDRTVQLEAANRELEAFSYSASHDLRAPLRAMQSFAGLLESNYAAQWDERARRYFERIQYAAGRMNTLIDDLLRLAKVSRAELQRQPVNLSQLATEIMATLQVASPERQVRVKIADSLVAEGDPGLLRAALENLLSNAWKYTGKLPPGEAVIEFGAEARAGGATTYYVRDNGAGFDMAHAERLFAPFARMHSEMDFPGTGVGLATVQRILTKHGGRIRAESAPDKGATFYFTLALA